MVGHRPHVAELYLPSREGVKMKLVVKVMAVAAAMLMGGAAMAQATSMMSMSARFVAADLTPTDGYAAGFIMRPTQVTGNPASNGPVATEARARADFVTGGTAAEDLMRSGKWTPSTAFAKTLGAGESDVGSGQAWVQMPGDVSATVTAPEGLKSSAMLTTSASGSVTTRQVLVQSNGEVPGTTIEVAPFTKVTITLSWVGAGSAKTAQDSIIGSSASFTLRNMTTGQLVFQKVTPERSWLNGPHEFNEQSSGGDRTSSYTITNNSASWWVGNVTMQANQIVQKL